MTHVSKIIGESKKLLTFPPSQIPIIALKLPRLNSLFFLLAGISIALLLYWINPLSLDPKGARVLALAALMIFWWVSEALPLPVVALTPLILFPLLGIQSIKTTAVGYSNPVVFLFMGGFFIGLAIEKWDLHRRIALGIVHRTGTSGDRIILGFILATGFLSMWLSNTATTMMMFPIALSVIHVMKSSISNDKAMRNFSMSLMLVIAYSANFGGIATIIGTPPNVAYVGFMQERYQYEVAFMDWIKLCMPLSVAILLSLYFVMTKWLYPNYIRHDEVTHAFIKSELHSLGRLKTPERRTLVIFMITVFLWITKDLINSFKQVTLDDNMIALFGALLLFIVPSGTGTADKEEKILNWDDTHRLPWGILLLFGGGIALADALESAGIIKLLGNYLSSWSGTGILALIFVVTFSSLFLSEVMSNIAQVIVLSPLICGISDAMEVHPLLLGIPMTLGASCASMMPMGTPPNAIVFSSGYIPLRQMMRAGFVMNLICILLITLFCWLVLPGMLGRYQ